MAATVMLTARDRELLLAVTQKVRLFSQRQIAEHWWDGEMANARRRLKALVRAGLLSRLSAPARTLPPLDGPMVTWQPGHPAPDFGQVAYRLQHRWHRRAVRDTTAFLATERAAQLYGGHSRGELKHPTQATHDLGVAAVWLRLHRQAPAWAEAWRGEDLMSETRRGEKLPDAFIVNSAGETTWLIEFGGSYDAVRVRAFHEDCDERDLPYQIW